MPAIVVLTGVWAWARRKPNSSSGRFVRYPSLSVTAGSLGGGSAGCPSAALNGTGAGTSGL